MCACTVWVTWLALAAQHVPANGTSHGASIPLCCAQLKVLLGGGASANALDRWGATPLDEARRVAAAPVVEYLAEAVGGAWGVLVSSAVPGFCSGMHVAPSVPVPAARRCTQLALCRLKGAACPCSSGG